jgi:hypothetical protein
MKKIVKNLYTKVIEKTGNTFVHSYFELLYNVSRCFEKIKIYIDLESGIRKRKIPAYEKLKNNTEDTLIKTPVQMFIGKSLAVCRRSPKQNLIFPGNIHSFSLGWVDFVNVALGIDVEKFEKMTFYSTFHEMDVAVSLLNHSEYD